MPSKSYIDFLELLVDVDQLRETHVRFSNKQPGKKNLGFLTRSAIVMLCAAWERYNENVLLECIDKILTTNFVASSLSKYTKEYISSKVRESKNNIYPIELADSGWRNIWKGYAINETNTLNTPNSQNLNTLFKRFLGIHEYTSMWYKRDINKIDDFIKVRGEIAHNGSKAKYVRFQYLIANMGRIKDNVIQIDYSLSLMLKDDYGLKRTWKEEYFRDIISQIGK